MKHVIFAIFALIVSAQANAMSIKRFLVAELQTLELQSRTYLADQQPIGGELQMDIYNGDIRLFLNLPGTCPKNAMCIWAGPAPLKFDFETSTVERGSCGETITVSKTKPLVEGQPYATLTVTDYSTLVCKFMPPAWTNIELNVHGFIGETHIFTAERLH